MHARLPSGPRVCTLAATRPRRLELAVSPGDAAADAVLQWVRPMIANLHASSPVTTFLFTDIEDSTRLWEQDAARMRVALARHDALARACVEVHAGVVVKMIGDGLHAAFTDPLDAVAACLGLQRALGDAQATNGLTLRVRCGLHIGIDEQRDNDFFGTVVNRAARIMSVAHGGQVLLSQAVAALVEERLPEGAALRDLGAVRLRNLARPERIFQLLHPDLAGHFPPLRTLEATPNNLPQQLSSFVGRERELAAAKRLLRRSRVLTLLGVGGIGKTRLALRLAAEVLDDYADGVWLVELAPLADAALVPQAVASVLGVKEEAGRPVIEALSKHVADRQLLLVLDNCEHLRNACGDLAKTLLQASPRLSLLAASREHLHLAGEATYAVPPLSFPDPGQVTALAGIKRSEAVRLFVDRAAAAQAAFRLSAQNMKPVAEICARLDGIPLAIELAAARVSALAVDRIAERITDRFHLLTRGDQTALPRQQTLRALIDWSYDLLTGREKALLRRLAVFAGGWTIEGAEAMGCGEDLGATQLLDLLTQLVDKSLVVLEADGQRYRLLETVRQYAQERLAECAEEEHARARHLAFYLSLAEAARAELAGPRQGAWLERLDIERENLLVAHAACDRVQDGVAMGFRLVYALKPYWVYRGLLGLGRRVSEEALARPGADTRSFSRCRGLTDAGQINFYMGRYREALALLRESLELARELGDVGRIAVVLQPLGMSCIGVGDLPTARRHLDEALALARAQDNKRQLAGALNARAQLHRVEGELDAAAPLFATMLALVREMGDSENTTIVLLNLAMLAITRGEHASAREMLRDVLVIAEKTGSKPAAQGVIEVSAGLAASCGDFERAARFHGVADAQAAETGLHRDPADEAFLAPLMQQTRSELGEPRYAAAVGAGRTLPLREAKLQIREWLRR